MHCSFLQGKTLDFTGFLSLHVHFVKKKCKFLYIYDFFELT